MTVSEATNRLGVSYGYVHWLIETKRLPAEKLDGRWVVSEQAVELLRQAQQARQRALDLVEQARQAAA